MPIAVGSRGDSGGALGFANTNHYVHKFFPDVVGVEYVYKGFNYIFGCHPYSNLPFLPAICSKSKKLAVAITAGCANYIFLAAAAGNSAGGD